ncbi:RNA polymerase sigma factor RpoE [Minicystis rosea]|nr:RNA polymerase sigma factor RpoE [Minicystis rosea]
MIGAEPVAAPEAPARDPLAGLVSAASRGDRRAMGELLQAVSPHVRGAIVSIAAGHLDDVVQECLIAFVRALPGFRSESSIVHYARRIAVRTALHQRRARLLRRNVDQIHAEEEQGAHDEGAPPPSHALAAARRRALLASLLDELPEAQAETLALRVVLGHSLEEIAEVTSAPVNTVRTRMRLAREALRRRIEDDPMLAELKEVT